MANPAHVGDFTPTQGASSSATAVITQSLTAGQGAILLVSSNNATAAIASVVDSTGDTWFVDGASFQTANIGFNASFQIIWANILTTGSHTITVNFSPSAAFPTLQGSYFSGGPFARLNSAAQNTSGIAIATPTLDTTGHAVTVLFGNWFYDAQTVTMDAAWTGATSFDGNFLQTFYRLPTSAGMYKATAANGNTAAALENILALFQSGTGGNGQPFTPNIMGTDDEQAIIRSRSTTIMGTVVKTQIIG